MRTRCPGAPATEGFQHQEAYEGRMGDDDEELRDGAQSHLGRRETGFGEKWVEKRGGGAVNRSGVYAQGMGCRRVSGGMFMFCGKQWCVAQERARVRSCTMHIGSLLHAIGRDGKRTFPEKSDLDQPATARCPHTGHGNA